MGSHVRITIGDKTREGTVSDGSFNIEPGQLAFAPGSSGWKTRDEKEIKWMELFPHGGNASEKFGRPGSGAEIRLDNVETLAAASATPSEETNDRYAASLRARKLNIIGRPGYGAARRMRPSR